MDFFQSQDAAKRNTSRLVILFVLALFSLIAVTNILLFLIFASSADALDVPLLQRIDWSLFLTVSLAILVIVGVGSLYKISSLSKGGVSIAELMNGRLLVPGTDKLEEQRVLNVVEEMAIASGTPVPPVYLLDEEGINAFAAGFNPSDAIIGVTRGTITNLSREELQGVIAHEFSHILHGDMRLNIRLMGVLHGILVLGIIGYYILRSSSRRVSRRSKEGGAIVALGIAFIIIGYAGTFFGNIIKAAVSRQREFLADASAVQFTRNPDGIAGALKRIGASSKGSVLESAGTAEISHSLFGDGLKHSFSNLYATHPPLSERILRVQPNWDGRFDNLPKVELNNEPGEPKPKSQKHDVAGVLTGAVLAQQLLSHAGNPDISDLQEAQKRIAAIPKILLKASRDPFSARAVIYFLLLDVDGETMQKQMKALEKSAQPEVFDELRLLIDNNAVLDPQLRLTLVNICFPVLKQLTYEQYQIFRQNLDVLIAADNKTSLWEWVLQRVVLHQLDAIFENGYSKKSHKTKALADSRESCALVLGFLARAGKVARDKEQEAFNAAVQVLELGGLAYPEPSELSIDNINRSLESLASIKPLQKPAFLKACATCIAHDGKATHQEVEVFRAIAAVIDCPLPPIVIETSQS
ncbi:MAG: M48 family metallopeptidase [Pseudohongiellaceae bacterium]|nr:M48 family metallopeptidase [Pseudohongiellaceae bacterium]